MRHATTVVFLDANFLSLQLFFFFLNLPFSLIYLQDTEV